MNRKKQMIKASAMIGILIVSIASLAYLEVLSQKRLDRHVSQTAKKEKYDVVLDAGQGDYYLPNP